MDKAEKIFLALVGVALVALLIAEYRTPNAVQTVADETAAPENLVSGPSYLMYNSPWSFAPPIGNFIPKSGGQVGIIAGNSPGPGPAAVASCGCS